MGVERNIVDPFQRAFDLRETILLNDDLMVVEFSDTLQGKDTSKVIDIMSTRINEYVFRCKVNVKEIDPLAAEAYKTERNVVYKDISMMSDFEIESFIKKQEFDFPLWFKKNKGFDMKRVIDYNTPIILQVAGCNFHDGTPLGGCWYCFVDAKSNDGAPTGSKAYVSIDEVIEGALSAKEKIKNLYKSECNVDLNARVLRVSGGEPTIALDWILALWRNISKKGLDFVGQVDTNLSTAHVIEGLEGAGIYEKHMLEKLAEYPVKVLTAFKGTDPLNLESNVQAKVTFDEQKYAMKKFVNAGLDCFPQIYNPNPKTFRKFLTEMDSEISNFSLRLHVGPLKIYSPTRERLTLEAKRLGRDPELFIKEKSDEWGRNYRICIDILDDYLRYRFDGIGYKDTTRSDVIMRVI